MAHAVHIELYPSVKKAEERKKWLRTVVRGIRFESRIFDEVTSVSSYAAERDVDNPTALFPNTFPHPQVPFDGPVVMLVIKFLG